MTKNLQFHFYGGFEGSLFIFWDRLTRLYALGAAPTIKIMPIIKTNIYKIHKDRVTMDNHFFLYFLLKSIMDKMVEITVQTIMIKGASAVSIASDL